MEFIKVIDRYGETVLINVAHIAVLRTYPDDQKVEITLSVLDRDGKRNEKIRTDHIMRDVENALKPIPLDDKHRSGLTQTMPKKAKKEAKTKK